MNRKIERSIERERTDRGRETTDEQRKIDGRKNSSGDKTQKETKQKDKAMIRFSRSSFPT